jgi:hypothetical protein
MRQPPHDTASELAAEDGEVIIDGPGGVAFSFTPEAALETSNRMLEAGLMAVGQRCQKADDRKRRP